MGVQSEEMAAGRGQFTFMGVQSEEMAARRGRFTFMGVQSEEMAARSGHFFTEQDKSGGLLHTQDLARNQLLDDSLCYTITSMNL